LTETPVESSLVTQRTPNEIIAKANSQMFDDLGIMNLTKEARFMQMCQYYAVLEKVLQEIIGIQRLPLHQ